MEQPREGPFRCPRCASVTWGNLNYCNDCGQSLNVECPGCGGSWRYIFQYTFCPSCGMRVGTGKS